MPLSISNSNSRIPEAPYKRLWLWTLIIMLIAVVGSEFFWRRRNFLPTVVDTKMFWGIKREQVYNDKNGKKKIVILGASRAQVGLVPEIFEEEFPSYDVVHLALEGTTPFWILKDLAEDPQFNGIIICGMTVNWLLPTDHEESKPWVDYYHANFGKLSNLDKKLNASFQAWLQSKLVIFSPRLTLQSLLKTRFSPRPLYGYMRLDRYRLVNYSRMNLEELREHKEWRINNAAKAFKNVPNNAILLFEKVVKKDLAKFHALMRDKGGKIILVRMPTSDEHWEYSQEAFPKETFWDRITKWSEMSTIHFYDFEGLSGFECPDASHLDATDAPEFTRNMIAVMKQIMESEQYNATATGRTDTYR